MVVDEYCSLPADADPQINRLRMAVSGVARGAEEWVSDFACFCHSLVRLHL